MLRAETLGKQDDPVQLRRISGPTATELYLLCEPPPNASASSAARQSEWIYASLLERIVSEGGSAASIVSETLFLRDAASDLEAVLAGRSDALGAEAAAAVQLGIGQPPINESANLAVALQAIIPHTGDALSCERVRPDTGCPCAACAVAAGVSVRIPTSDETRFYASGLCGVGDDAYAQTLAMFEAAEALLSRAGMGFRDVVRTWIHLREIDRDYDAFNHARRAFFEARGVDPVPASTGIAGAPASDAHDLCLGIYALQKDQAVGPVPRFVMTSPTLNEAGSYGADFVRGMRVPEANKVGLHVSGTASIDEHGATVHVGDFESQADRMILNVSSLLAKQGADFGNIVSAMTYVKRPEDAPLLQQKFREAGYVSFPNVFVHAPVCRPELLCETEALAVLPEPTRRS
ncbi:MAG: RidA family protein [Myxococcota bacterium]